MPRFVLAFLVSLGCALACFAMPSILSNSFVRGAPPEVAHTAQPGEPAQAVTQQPAVAPAQAPAPREVSFGERASGLIGMALLLGIAVAMSRNRRAISWRVVAWGLGLQIVFGIFVLRVEAGQVLFAKLGDFIKHVLNFSYEGSSFVFGDLGKPNSSLGMVFAFQILPAIIFVSALFAIMYHLGVMQLIVRAMATVMSKIMGASGAESTNVAASIFMGQTEAPLTIRPFLPRLTQSELMTVMTAGMAHISGSIMQAYIAFGVEAKHLLTAVIMTAPGAIMMAKILEPETGEPETRGNADIRIEKQDVNVVAAAARGTSEGLHLMLNVIAMLIAFVALVALVNGLFGWIHSHWSMFPPTLQTVLGWVGQPFAWAMGVPTKDCAAIGALMGERTVLNEFIAFLHLGEMRDQLDPRSFTIASFALAGFANISSVGIQIGGIGALVPERKADLARLGFRAMLAGTLANFMSGTIAGILL